MAGVSASHRPTEGRVLVVGSVNHDHFVDVDALPKGGETIPAQGFSTGLGGKGANQAVAAALAGATVAFAGAVGDDASGRFAQQTLARYGVDARALRAVSAPTGAAYITVDAAGENIIVVVSGANTMVGADALDVAEAPAIIVTQGELPSAVIAAAAQTAERTGVRFLLNLAPVIAIAAEHLAVSDPLVVNEHEAAVLLDRDAPDTAADALEMAEALGRATRSVIVTLGAAGAIVKTNGSTAVHVPAASPPGPVLDTTGAGDAFVGVLAARLALGDSLEEGARVAATAAAIAVSRRGTIASYPDAAEIEHAQ